MGYRNAATIEAAVQSVVTQQARERFEVVVVTSGGDGSAAIVTARFPGVQVIESPTRLLPGGARNAGVAATDSDVVAFLAADCLALPGWIDRRIEHHRRGHRVVSGSVCAGPDDGLPGRAAVFLLFPGRLPGHRPGPASHPQSFGLSYTRSLLDELGPFDASLRTGEDSVMARRLEELGERPWFDPAIRTAHPGPERVCALLRDQYRRGGLRLVSDVLRPPTGRLRRLAERTPSPVVRAGVAAAVTARGLPKRIRWTARTAWRGADDHGVLLRTAP